MSKSIADFTAEERTQMRLESLAKRNALYDNFIGKNPYKLKSFFLRLPETVKWGWYQCFAGIASKTVAIKQKCLDCSVYDKSEVTQCTAYSCPLHKYRPYQKKESCG